MDQGRSASQVLGNIGHHPGLEGEDADFGSGGTERQTRAGAAIDRALSRPASKRRRHAPLHGAAEPHGWRELRHALFKVNVELEWFEKHARGREYEWEKAPSVETEEKEAPDSAEVSGAGE